MFRRMLSAAVLALILAGTLTWTANIQPVKANPGAVTITVQYLDGCPRSDANVWIYAPINKEIGTTGEDGKVTNSELGLSEGTYWIKANWPNSATQFGPNTELPVDANGDGSQTIEEDYEITPPEIQVLSPENRTYTTSSVDLTFTVYDYSSISWMGYSLDSQSNVTVTGNTTLTGLSLGQHNVIVYANDTYGNMGSSDRVYFTRIYGCVTIKVQYKDGYPRSGADVFADNATGDYPLGTTDENGLTIRYDKLAPGDYGVKAYWPNSGTQFGPPKSLTVNATGYGGATITADYPAPLVTITVRYLDGCPTEGAEVWVVDPDIGCFGITNSSGKITRCGFLDPGDYWIEAWIGVSKFAEGDLTVDGNGKENRTLTGGYEITSPVLEVFSPLNMTYISSSLSLNFTVYDFSPISWIGYSLDNQANVTITGNTTLTDLAIGQHSIVVYANDTYGNMGYSDKIYFTIANDIAITNVTTTKTIIGQGYSMSINVTIENQGAQEVTFNVTAYANTTVVDTITNITLTSGNSTILTFTWNTLGFVKGNYTISAVADTVSGETETGDNTFIDGSVIVSTPGDVDGDGVVGGLDSGLLGYYWPPQPYYPDCDIDCDGVIGGLDAGLIGYYWGT